MIDIFSLLLGILIGVAISSGLMLLGYKWCELGQRRTGYIIDY